ncbi:unnamed protein product [Adineta steineri]|uniref:F-box domain-containing protein n=1 Tax=Adineta steineri TaxID=433720 RepID=A0A815CJU9_9BILA|nr:unnamed protein product [Adineta steineri]CAF1281292.1 unnamed protein product [Adineta steineri]
MDIESFPNEIFLELFDYINGIDLFRAFYGLNSRFNNLLYKQFRTYHFQFASISKFYFDLICQQHIPFIADKIVGICLSESYNTPEQINLFLSYIPSWNQFTCLRTLSLSNIPSLETLLKLLDICHQLCNLTHLRLSLVYLRISRPELQPVINNIWSLPKLIRCDFDIGISLDLFCLPTTISSTLQYLSVKGHHLEWKQINRLFKSTPCLTHLSISMAMSDHDNYKLFYRPALIKLKIDVFFSSDFSQIVIFLKALPNLRCLDVHFRTGLIYGYQWEEAIRNYLPKLKTLRFSMNRFYGELYPQILLRDIANSYRSSFWIDEHQWFVQCYIRDRTIYLYTSSHRFHDFGDTFNYPDSWTSTCPYDNQQNFCDNITDVSYEMFSQRRIPSTVRMRNIEHLSITLPINDQFWSIVPSLNRLHSLMILSSHIDHFQSQLQTLFNRAPNLCRLVIDQNKSSHPQMLLFKCTNASIRELYLKCHNHNFSQQECEILVHSALGTQCEELSINVISYESIVYLVENMINLRSLDVQCHDEITREHFLSIKKHHEGSHNEHLLKKKKLSKWLKNHLKIADCTGSPHLKNGDDENMSNTDRIIHWLHDRLPSRCIIVRNPTFSQSILIWI